MIVYPDIELQKGRCVNLARGRTDVSTVYDVDPVEAACDFALQGAQWLHVVDLDAVFNVGDNAAIINEIIRKAKADVQVGGAIRSLDRVRKWIDAGAKRVVIATAAVKNPHFVMEAATAYPDQVVVSVNARGGKVLVEGWRETTVFTPIEFARLFDRCLARGNRLHRYRPRRRSPGKQHGPHHGAGLQHPHAGNSQRCGQDSRRYLHAEISAEHCGDSDEPGALRRRLQAFRGDCHCQGPGRPDCAAAISFGGSSSPCRIGNQCNESMALLHVRTDS